MDDFWVLLKGFAIGLAIAIPVGPIALLCMRRTLERGFTFGFATGLGAATADLFYSAIAALGLAWVEEALLRYQLPLFLLFGLFLLGLAIRTALRSTAVVREVNAGTSGIAGAFVSGFVLTATNPLTVLGIFAIFAGFVVGNGAQALSLVIGVVAGSATWWLTLTTVVARIRHLFADRTLHALNFTAAALLAAFAVYFLVKALMMAAPWLF